MFFDGTLDDPEALSTIEPVLRDLAGAGARVRLADLATREVLEGLETSDRPRAVVAGGRDGRLFRAVLEPVCPVPFVAWPHPGLPGWAGPLDLVVLVCADGDDQDEISAVGEARRRGCSVLVSAPEGSPMHEASAGRSTTFLPAGTRDAAALAVPVLRALHLLGLGPQVEAEPVADALDDVAERCGPGVTVDENPAKDLALVLADDVPVVWGGSVLAARAARRIAEALRSATGRPAIAGDDTQIVPLLASAPEVDLFADPFEDGNQAAARPALIMLDDGSDAPAIRAERARLQVAADAAGVRIHEVRAIEGPGIGRFAALLATGRFTAAYLALGLGRPA